MHIQQISPKPLWLKVISTQQYTAHFVFEHYMQKKCNDVPKKYN